MFNGISQSAPLWVNFSLVLSTPSITLPYPFTSHYRFFNSFQNTSLYPLPSQMLDFIVLLMLYHSLFLAFFHQVPWSSSTVTNMFYIWICIWPCLFLCICLSFVSIFHLWEKTWGLCLSQPDLLYLTDIFQFHPFTFKPCVIVPCGWVKLHCVYIQHFLDPFINCRVPGLFPKLGYCEHCCDEHQGTGVSIVSWLKFLWVDAQDWYS
jgi:hypothetical protein